MGENLYIDIGAIIISFIALLLSIYSMNLQKKINEINLQAKYFEEIFQEYFVQKIPNAARKLDFNSDNKLDVSYKELNKVIMEMIKDCAYFAYAKHDFYEELCQKTKDFEEKMINMAGEVQPSRDEQVKRIYSLHQDLMDIVKFINKNYMKV